MVKLLHPKAYINRLKLLLKAAVYARDWKSTLSYLSMLIRSENNLIDADISTTIAIISISLVNFPLCFKEDEIYIAIELAQQLLSCNLNEKNKVLARIALMNAVTAMSAGNSSSFGELNKEDWQFLEQIDLEELKDIFKLAVAHIYIRSVKLKRAECILNSIKSNEYITEVRFLRAKIQDACNILDADKTLKKSLTSISKLTTKKRVIILNLGFAKCGSTFLQSRVLPNLFLQNYCYLGRCYDTKYHTINANNSLDPFLIPIQKEGVHLLSDDDKIKRISCALSKYNAVAFSSEILPDINAALSLSKSIENYFRDAIIVNVCTTRDIRKSFWSGYCHKNLQYYVQTRKTFTVEDYMNNSLPKGFNGPKPGELNYGKLLYEFNSQVKADLIFSDISKLNNNRIFWQELASLASDQVESINPSLDNWMKFMNEVSHKGSNQKSKKAEYILGLSYGEIPKEVRSELDKTQKESEHYLNLLRLNS